MTIGRVQRRMQRCVLLFAASLFALTLLLSVVDVRPTGGRFFDIATGGGIVLPFSRRLAAGPLNSGGAVPPTRRSVAVPRIAIFLTVHNQTALLTEYRTAVDSLRCYAQMHAYPLEIVYLDGNRTLDTLCPQKDLMFKRHCAAALLLPRYDWLLFLDADIGVVNPVHLIEEWIDESVGLIFYDRFFNWEVTAGTYLAKNTAFTRQFLNDWAAYDQRLPGSFHGSDNGAIHALLMDVLAPEAGEDGVLCHHLWNRSASFSDLFLFEACVRFVIGANRVWPSKIKLLPKGQGWARDGWLTGTRWSPRDFMLHGWKESSRDSWSFGPWKMPFANDTFDMATCANPGMWRWKPELQVTDEEVEKDLGQYARSVLKDFWTKAGKIARLL